MRAGERLGDKYRILGPLGQGGTSTVYLAENIVLKNLWAIKAIPRNNPCFDYEMQELTLLKNLSHPMLPRIADLFEDAACSYIVMDYIKGTNLLDYVQNHGKVKEEVLIRWTKDLLDVLKYLHQKTPPIIYRDLKPSNIILDEDQHLRLVDFGTARIDHENSIEDTLYIGTQGYAAPEQYGSGKSDARTDLYNLGKTLFHLATGMHPQKLGKLPQNSCLRQAGLSRCLVNLIDKLTRQDPSDRPQNCDEALNLLKQNSFALNIFVNKKEKLRAPIKSTIALSAIRPGTGLTSLAIGLAGYFSSLGLRAALVEMNPSGDMESLENILKETGRIKKQGEGFYELEQTVLYKAVSDLGQVPRKNLDILILDLGPFPSEKGINELNRADVKLVLCPQAIWKLPEILEFKERYNSCNSGNEWVFALSASGKDQEWYIKKHYGINRAVTFPVLKNPFSLEKEEKKLLGESIHEAFNLADLKLSLKA